jgi:hypothetical protein
MLEIFLIISITLVMIISYFIFTFCIHKIYNNNVSNIPENNNNVSIAVPMQNQNIHNNEIVTVRSILV